MRRAELACASLTLMGTLLASASDSLALRKAIVGEPMPPFSLADARGDVFAYEHGQNRTLLIVFLASGQQNCERAYRDLSKMADDFRTQDLPLELVGISAQMDTGATLRASAGDLKSTIPVLIDSEYALWGQLGITATPTILVVGADDSIRWVKAGYSHDFAPAVRAQVMAALGKDDPNSGTGPVAVEAARNATLGARVGRHLKMARVFEEKGRIERVLRELRKAHDLDPNNLEVLTSLGLGLCRAGQAEQALDIAAAGAALPEISEHKRFAAKLSLISGWAYQLLGDLPVAEDFLVEAVRLDPSSARASFELGKLYQGSGRHELAMQTYRGALNVLFGEPNSPPNDEKSAPSTPQSDANSHQ